MVILAAAIILTLNNNIIMNSANKAVTDSNLREVQAAFLGWLESYSNGARSVASLQEGVDSYLTQNGVATSH